MKRQVALLHVCRRQCRVLASPVRLSSTGSNDGSEKPPKSGNLPVPEGATLSATAFADCTHCGKPLKGAPTVNSSSNYLRCSECQRLYSTGRGRSEQKGNGIKQQDNVFKRPPYPQEIFNYLERYVVGQRDAKRTLAVGVYQHYRRLANNIERKLQKQQGQGVQPVNMGGIHPANQFNGTFGSPHISSIPNQFHDHFTVSESHPTPNVTHLTYHPSRGPPITSNEPQSHIPDFESAFKRMKEDEEMIRLEKSNIMLLGPSGVGKTFVTQVLARILDVPIALCDCTSMTQAGYVGEDVESVLQKLLQNANGNVERAQQGIVFLDEVDKIAATGDNGSHAYRDVAGEGVQHALLKLVEGTVANVKSGRKAPGQQDTVQMDTTDILFVSSGAFTGLEKIVGQRLDKRSVGFGSASNFHSITGDDKIQAEINEKRDKLLSEADQGDLIKFGIVPELVGRFPVIVPFHSFNREMLVRVLTEPKNSLLAQMKTQFAMDGVELDFDQEALEEISALALERKTGARALRSIIEKVLLVAKFEVPGSDIEKVTVTRDCVKGKEGYVYERRRQEQEPEIDEKRSAACA
ncbi:unnamed protein product [Bursaphelenchus xylophilus]|nr:unnamed protein product [Bursaphelenchus xylophilus]CAG9088368.1 unnamed protein product [Bursaphelenchus xylophilus]